MTDVAVVLVALLVVGCSAVPFLVAGVLIGRGQRRAHLDAELSRLLDAPRAPGQGST